LGISSLFCILNIIIWAFEGFLANTPLSKEKLGVYKDIEKAMLFRIFISKNWIYQIFVIYCYYIKISEIFALKKVFHYFRLHLYIVSLYIHFI